VPASLQGKGVRPDRKAGRGNPPADKPRLYPGDAAPFVVHYGRSWRRIQRPDPAAETGGQQAPPRQLSRGRGGRRGGGS